MLTDSAASRVRTAVAPAGPATATVGAFFAPPIIGDAGEILCGALRLTAFCGDGVAMTRATRRAGEGVASSDVDAFAAGCAARAAAAAVDSVLSQMAAVFACWRTGSARPRGRNRVMRSAVKPRGARDAEAGASMSRGARDAPVAPVAIDKGERGSVSARAPPAAERTVPLSTSRRAGGGDSAGATAPSTMTRCMLARPKIT